MGVWFSLHIPLVMGFAGEIDGTVQIKNGTESVNLSCGAVPLNIVATEWSVHKHQMKKILKFYLNKSGNSSMYYNNYTADKYSISEYVNTSIVIKNIALSDTNYYICGIRGQGIDYRYTIMLEVQGKSLFGMLRA